MGHGARGLQRRRQRLGLLQPRSGPLARLSLGRGRPGRHLRRPAAALLRAGPVEWQGPDPQGTPVRADQQRKQSRRGRQGVLLLPRQHADPFVHEVPLQVSAGGLSVRQPRRDQPPPRPERIRVRTARYGRVRSGSLLRRVRGVRQGVPRGHADPDHASTTAARKRPSCTSCRRSGSATSGPGMAVPTGPRCTRSPAPRERASSRPSIPSWENASSAAKGTCRCCSRRTKPTPSASSACPTAARTSRTASTTTSSTARKGP